MALLKRKSCESCRFHAAALKYKLMEHCRHHMLLLAWAWHMPWQIKGLALEPQVVQAASDYSWFGTSAHVRSSIHNTTLASRSNYNHSAASAMIFAACSVFWTLCI